MLVPLSVENHVAITIWKLIATNTLCSMTNQFGTGKSMAGKKIQEVCLEEIMGRFASLGFPNCVGPLDGTYIAMLSPVCCGCEFINWKGYFSFVLHVVVYCHGHFIHKNAGWSSKRA